MKLAGNVVRTLKRERHKQGKNQSDGKPLALWCLLRQDLFLNQQPEPFLIVHWKHTFDAITLLDVIPGDRTELANA